MPVESANFFLDQRSGVELAVARGVRFRYPEHIHISVQTLTLIRRGTVRLQLNGGSSVMEPGAGFTVWPYEPHSVEAEESFETVSVCIPSRAASPAGRGKRRGALLGGIERFRREGFLTGEEMEAVRDLFVDEEPRSVSGGPEDALTGLKNDLEGDPLGGRNLDDMARQVHLDKWHLIRRFKKRYGLSPCRFQKHLRLRIAKKACVRAASLAAAAVEAGFYDESHLARFLKEWTGLTPGQYRSAWRGDWVADE